MTLERIIYYTLSYIQYEHYGRKNVRQKKLKELPVEFPYIDEVDYDALRSSFVFVDGVVCAQARVLLKLAMAEATSFGSIV